MTFLRRQSAAVVLLFSGWVAPNPLGYAVVIAQAAGVLVLADLEYMGMKRSPVPA